MHTYKHHSSLKNLRASARQGCELCQLIAPLEEFYYCAEPERRRCEGDKQEHEVGNKHNNDCDSLISNQIYCRLYFGTGGEASITFEKHNTDRFQIELNIFVDEG
jgi:hypothetical protein